jgi:hypothetical protein
MFSRSCNIRIADWKPVNVRDRHEHSARHCLISSDGTLPYDARSWVSSKSNLELHTHDMFWNYTQQWNYCYSWQPAAAASCNKRQIKTKIKVINPTTQCRVTLHYIDQPCGAANILAQESLSEGSYNRASPTRSLQQAACWPSGLKSTRRESIRNWRKRCRSRETLYKLRWREEINPCACSL